MRRPAPPETSVTRGDTLCHMATKPDARPSLSSVGHPRIEAAEVEQLQALSARIGGLQVSSIVRAGIRAVLADPRLVWAGAGPALEPVPRLSEGEVGASAAPPPPPRRRRR